MLEKKAMGVGENRCRPFVRGDLWHGLGKSQPGGKSLHGCGAVPYSGNAGRVWGKRRGKGVMQGCPPPPHYLLLLLFSLRLSFIFVLRPRAPNPPSCLKKGMLFALLFLVCFAFFPSTLLSECCCSMGCRGSVSHCPPSEPPHFGAVGLCPLGLLCWLFFPSPFFFPPFLPLFFSPLSLFFLPTFFPFFLSPPPHFSPFPSHFCPFLPCLTRG